MALTVNKANTFKAKIIFTEDGSSIEVVGRAARPIDYHLGDEGNRLANLYYTYSNVIQRFDKPVQVTVEDGSTLNIYTFRELVDLGITMDLSDFSEKWANANAEAQNEKERLIKKSKSAGGSSNKGTPPDKD